MEAKGRVNRYLCEACNNQIFTLNMSTGTTPFMSKCPFCGDWMQSSFYRVPAGLIEVSHIWFRPKAGNFNKLSAEVQAHIQKGGLIQGTLDDMKFVAEEDLPTNPHHKIFKKFMFNLYG